MLTDLCNYLSSEQGQEIIKQVFSGIIGSASTLGLMALKWAWGRIGRPSPELSRILDGLNDSVPDERVVRTGAVEKGYALTRTLKVLKLEGSDIAVNDRAEMTNDREWAGVVYLGDKDHSELYDQKELAKIVRKAQDRRKQINELIRQQQRQLLANNVPSKKA